MLWQIHWLVIYIMSLFSECHSLLCRTCNCSHVVTISNRGFLMVSYGRNNLLCQLCTWFHIEDSCSASCLIFPYTWIFHLLCLIIQVMNKLKGIEVILCQYCISTIDCLEFLYLFLGCVKYPCAIYPVYQNVYTISCHR